MTYVGKKPIPLTLDLGTQPTTSKPAARPERSTSRPRNKDAATTDGPANERPSTPPPRPNPTAAQQALVVPQHNIVRQGRPHVTAPADEVSAQGKDVQVSVPSLVVTHHGEPPATAGGRMLPSTLPRRPAGTPRPLSGAPPSNPSSAASPIARRRSANDATGAAANGPTSAHASPLDAFKRMRGADAKTAGADLRRDAGLLKVLMEQKQGLKTLFFIDSKGGRHFGAHRPTEATVTQEVDGETVPVPGAQHKELCGEMIANMKLADVVMGQLKSGKNILMSSELFKLSAMAITTKPDPSRLGGTRLKLNEKEGTLVFDHSEFYKFAPAPLAPEGLPHEEAYQKAAAKVAQYNAMIDDVVAYHVSVLKLTGLADRLTASADTLSPPREGSEGGQSRLRLGYQAKETKVLAERLQVALGMPADAPAPFAYVPNKES